MRRLFLGGTDGISVMPLVIVVVVEAFVVVKWLTRPRREPAAAQPA